MKLFLVATESEDDGWLPEGSVVAPLIVMNNDSLSNKELMLEFGKNLALAVYRHFKRQV